MEASKRTQQTLAVLARLSTVDSPLDLPDEFRPALKAVATAFGVVDSGDPIYQSCLLAIGQPSTPKRKSPFIRLVVDWLNGGSELQRTLLEQAGQRRAARADELAINEFFGSAHVPGDGAGSGRGDSEERRDYYSRLSRPGQQRFRSTLLKRYGGTCPLSGCRVAEVLEAAHIRPVVDGGSDSVLNGILLRCDLHALFDRHLITCVPDEWQTKVAPELRKTCYRRFHGKAVVAPHPCADAAAEHLAASEALWEAMD